MNRRSLLKGFAAGVAGLQVPVGVVEAAEAARRWWALGAVPVHAPSHLVVYLYDERTRRETLLVDGQTAQVHLRGVERYRDQQLLMAMGRIMDLQSLPTNQMGWALVSGRNDV